MRWERQITTTLSLGLEVSVTRLMLGFTVVDDRKPADNPYGFIMAVFFVGPFGFSLMIEPLRQKQLDWAADMANKEAELERAIASFEHKNK